MRKNEPFCLYVHIPYCTKKCPYCDFNSYSVGVGKGAFPEASYVEALIVELSACARRDSWKNRELRSIFFGGGTPSLLSADSVFRIIDTASRFFQKTETTETSLEANPGSISESLSSSKLTEFRAAGVNRLSIGAQSFSPKKLRFLGRIHSAQQTQKAVSYARAAGFSNLSLDLMFGVEGESLSDWKIELQRALELSPEHISAYALTIEPGTEFSRITKQGKTLSAGDEEVSKMLSYNLEFLPTKNFFPYEISNFSKPQHHCLHNLAYWNEIDYLGIGAGAHSFLKTSSYCELNPDEEFAYSERWSNIPGPSFYIERVQKTSQAVHRREQINLNMLKTEFIETGLRLCRGLNRERLIFLCREERKDKLLKKLDFFIEKGFADYSSSHFSLTETGLLFCDSVAVSLLEEL